MGPLVPVISMAELSLKYEAHHLRRSMVEFLLQMFPINDYPTKNVRPALTSLIATAMRASSAKLHALLPACFYYMASYNINVLSSDLSPHVPRHVYNQVLIGRENLVLEARSVWVKVSSWTSDHPHCQKKVKNYFLSNAGLKQLSSPFLFGWSLFFLKGIRVCPTCQSRVS